MDIKKLFAKPCIISVAGDVNSGKSNLLYYIVNELREKGKFSLFSYGLKSNIKDNTEVHSVNELEQIKNSVIIIDEFFTLYDLDNRKIKNQIENTLRLINHNNNILILCGVGENFKKFISAKVDYFIYKKLTFDDMINGSRVKQIILNYKGSEKGSSILNLDKNEAIIYDGHYNKITIPYMKEYDSKKDNKDIIRSAEPKNDRMEFNLGE